MEAMDTFADDLNAAVGMIGEIPRVRFEIDLCDGAERWIRKKHANGAVHEPATIAAFLAIARRFTCRTIFDVGALYGYFTLLALQLFEDVDVTAFEMHPCVVDPLRRNVTKYVTCVHAAVSDKSRPKVKIWISGFNIFEEPDGGWPELEKIPAAMKERGNDNRGRGFAVVDFIMLDAFCAAAKPPDLIKIDVEGYQAKAILGGLQTIQRSRPVIVIELHDPEKLQRFGTTNRQTVQPLFDLGYQAYWCGDHRSPDARFEQVRQMSDVHEKLSLMVFIP